MENLENTLDKVIIQSATNVQDELNVKTEKKKRGRKPKNTKIEVNNLVGDSDTDLVKMSKEQYKGLLGMLFSVSGMYLAKATKFEGFNMTPDELEQISESGSVVCVQFMPVVNSKYVAVGAFIGCTGLIYGQKVIAYKKHMAVLNAKRTDDGIKKD